MKFFIPSSLFCLAFFATNVAVTADECADESTLAAGTTEDYSGEPITILSQDTDSVTFTVSQTWSDDMLCLIGTDYTNVSDEDVCPHVANAAPGEIAEYTAKCVGGFAYVDLYVYDPSFADNTAAPTIPAECEQTQASKTYLYQYTIPCGGATCTTPEETSCEYMEPVDIDFQDGDVSDWLFGELGQDGTNNYLELDASTLEVSKTFDIPSGTTGVEFVFDFITVSPLGNDQKTYIRVGDYYLNVADAFANAVPLERLDYFAQIAVTTKSLSDATVQAKVVVPASLYSGGSVSFGVRSTSATSTSYIAGVDNVKMNLVCDATRSPSATPVDGFTGGTHSGGGGGDPHFQRWDREHGSFHGECDLVMVHSDQFHNNAGLDLHVRTTIEDYFSFIESAALRVGKYTLEFHQRHFYLDGTKYTAEDLPLTFGDDFKYTVTNEDIEIGKNPRFYQYFKVTLGEDSSMMFRFYKKFLTISVEGHANDFSDSTGLLGEFETGEMLSRDGAIMTDFDQYGFEWQVSPEDAKLFMDARAPQLPFEQCRMPTAARPARRKLRGGDAALYEQAQQACANVVGNGFDLCIDDVLATGDVGLASLW